MVILLTMLCSVPIILAGLIKIALPLPGLWRRITQFCNFVMWLWANGLAALLRVNIRLTWEIEGLKGLSRDNWYLLICNHQSWADIVVLCVLFRHQIPMNKYFLKQQLAWIPFMGLACQALDMPFMKRFSQKWLLRHPEMRGQDIETTRRSCEKFKRTPTTIVNFVEGSRFTREKHRQQRSPFTWLLTPKAAGVAIALNVLGDQFDKILNVTLCYPENRATPFKDMLSGRLTRIVVHVALVPVTDELRGDYIYDQQFKHSFQRWLNELWSAKDARLNGIYRRYKKAGQ